MGLRDLRAGTTAVIGDSCPASEIDILTADITEIISSKLAEVSINRARDEAAFSEDFLSPPTHTNTSVLIQRVSGQIRALCDTPLGYPNDGILPLLHFDAKYDSSHVESLIRLLYRGVLRWMSDLRES